MKGAHGAWSGSRGRTTARRPRWAPAAARRCRGRSGTTPRAARAAVSDAVVTTIVGSTLRTTCTWTTCSFEAPISSAASTYWARECSRVAALVIRKKTGRAGRPPATMACTRPLPSAAVTATAKKTYGSVISASATRFAAKSNPRPRNTVAMPERRPAPGRSPTASRAVSTDSRVPGHQPAEHVPAEVVRAEQVVRAGPLEQRVGVERERLLGASMEPEQRRGRLSPARTTRAIRADGSRRHRAGPPRDYPAVCRRVMRWSRRWCGRAR